MAVMANNIKIEIEFEEPITMTAGEPCKLDISDYVQAVSIINNQKLLRHLAEQSLREGRLGKMLYSFSVAQCIAHRNPLTAGGLREIEPIPISIDQDSVFSPRPVEVENERIQ